MRLRSTYSNLALQYLKSTCRQTPMDLIQIQAAQTAQIHRIKAAMYATWEAKHQYHISLAENADKRAQEIRQ